MQSTVAAQIKAVLHSAPNWSKLSPDQQEALDMNAVKTSRILCGDPDFPDHWHDICGYSKLVEDRLAAPKAPKRRRKRSQ